MKGKLVVVGGHSRRVGKTSMVRNIERATPDMNWFTVKISNHSHAVSAVPPAASVARSGQRLLRLTDEEFGSGIGELAALLEAGRNLLVESNRIVGHLRPGLVIFVIDPLNPDWKRSSSACLGHADALVFSQDGPCPAPLRAVPRILPSFRLTAWNQAPLGFNEWIRRRLLAATAEVTSNETATTLLGITSHVPASAAGRRCADGSRGPQTGQVGQRAGARLNPFPVGSLELV